MRVAYLRDGVSCLKSATAKVAQLLLGLEPKERLVNSHDYDQTLREVTHPSEPPGATKFVDATVAVTNISPIIEIMSVFLLLALQKRRQLLHALVLRLARALVPELPHRAPPASQPPRVGPSALRVPEGVDCTLVRKEFVYVCTPSEVVDEIRL